MVVASNEKILSSIELPIIDLSFMVEERSDLSKLIVKACEEYGFFKVINHGVSPHIIARMEQEGLEFFGKPMSERTKAGPPNPFGYGRNNIGFNGDMGQVEYLLLNTNPLSISHISQTISNDPSKFSEAVNCYIEAVRELACELLDLMAEGLWAPDTRSFSNLIRDVDSDSVFRLNHYPPFKDTSSAGCRIGFGEHTDPQILTILRSNDVGGLQISVGDQMWVPVSPDPTAFCVNVGDLLQAMTNGRFISVKHRAMTYSSKSRMSMAYFAAPPLHSLVSPVLQTLHSNYRHFTWEEYKKASYSLRLGDTRLHHFRINSSDDHASA